MSRMPADSNAYARARTWQNILVLVLDLHFVDDLVFQIRGNLFYIRHLMTERQLDRQTVRETDMTDLKDKKYRQKDK